MPDGRWSWLDDGEDLQVFVPGLMATGILVSIGMLIWDGIKKVFPDVGSRQRAATSTERTLGRVRDLTSIETGESPAAVRVRRIRRSRGSSLRLALVALSVCGATIYMTLTTYSEGEGPLAGRGWTLSLGLMLAASFGLLAVGWLWSSSTSDRMPGWMETSHSRWPLGVLPKPDDGNA